MANTTDNKTCLHLVLRSSAELVDRCSDFFREGDEVLFMDDGVMCLVTGRFGASRMHGARGLFVAADLDARGLAQVARDTQIRVVSDEEFPGLLRKHDTCLTWK